MNWIDKHKELTASPNATGRDGIHISVQLRVDAMQLRSHRIEWAAQCMERAADRIDELENRIMGEDGDERRTEQSVGPLDD